MVQIQEVNPNNYFNQEQSLLREWSRDDFSNPVYTIVKEVGKAGIKYAVDKGIEKGKDWLKGGDQTKTGDQRTLSTGAGAKTNDVLSEQQREYNSKVGNTKSVSSNHSTHITNVYTNKRMSYRSMTPYRPRRAARAYRRRRYPIAVPRRYRGTMRIGGFARRYNQLKAALPDVKFKDILFQFNVFNNVYAAGPPYTQPLNTWNPVFDNLTVGKVGVAHPMAIAQGTGQSQRLSYKAHMKSIAAHWIFKKAQSAMATSSSSIVIKIIWIQGKSANGAYFTGGEVFADQNITTYMNLANSRRFRVLKTDEWCMTSPTNDGVNWSEACLRVDQYIPLRNMVVDWDQTVSTTGDIAEMTTNNVFPLMFVEGVASAVGDLIACTVQYRTKFTG